MEILSRAANAFGAHVNNKGHQVMEHLLEAGYGPDNIDEPTMNEIRGRLAVLQYLAATIKENAPVTYQENNTYQQLLEGLFSSLDSLAQTLQANDSAAVSKSIDMLKPAYAKLFVNFG